MSRFFIEIAYKGTQYKGFQIQDNGITIQSELERALAIIQRETIKLTGASRTDAGVHALQNFFHFDYEGILQPHLIYKLNSLLGKDICIRKIYLMPLLSHSRFDAVSREYLYRLHGKKNPFLQEVSLFYPYPVNMELMQEAAQKILTQKNFYGFTKANSQVHHFHCIIERSEWSLQGEEMIFHIRANRFLRGMVRLLTASLLKVGMGKMSLVDFEAFFNGKHKTVYSVPSCGLFLCAVAYPPGYFGDFELDLQ